MLIITADDYGKTAKATDSIIKCYSCERITSVSSMVFMEDSARAASLASIAGFEIGLHLNFSLLFTSFTIPSKLREHQNRIVLYLSKNKYSHVICNPLLVDSFDYVFLSQQDEFVRLYGRLPDYYNGHHHMHLCANVLARRIIPYGARVRRTFTFDDDKNLINRFYRILLDIYVDKRFISTDCFYTIAPIQDYERLRKIVDRATIETIEIEVHPENDQESDFILSDEYNSLMKTAYKGCFRDLQ